LSRCGEYFFGPFAPQDGGLASLGDHIMINITFPDGNIKSFEHSPTGLDVAKSISEGFAGNYIAMEINSELVE